MAWINLGCDIDGVILDQGGVFLPYLHKANPNIKSIEDIIVYEVDKLGISQEEFRNILKNFEFTGQFLDIKSIPGAVEGIKELSRKGYTIDLITARNQYELVDWDTEFNLGRIGVLRGREYRELICDDNKYPIIQDRDIRFMFEDRPKAIEELSAKGIYCGCIAQPWNQKIKDNEYVRRISWDEAIDWVEEVNEKFYSPSNSIKVKTG